MESIRTSGHTSCPFESTNAWPDSVFAAGFSAILAGSAQAFPRNSGHSRVPTEFRVGDFFVKKCAPIFFVFFCFYFFVNFFRPPGRSPADRIFCEKVVFLDTLAPADVPRQIPGRSPGRYKKSNKKQKNQTKNQIIILAQQKIKKIFWHNEKSNNHLGKTKQAYQFCRAKSLEKTFKGAKYVVCLRDRKPHAHSELQR